MKKLINTYTFSALFIMLSAYSHAQTSANGRVLITGSRFTYPLVEQWMAGFKKVYPEVEVRILPRGGASADSGNLIINAHKLLPTEIKPNYTVVNIGKYAILPIVNPNSAFAREHVARGIREKEIKQYFFQEYDGFHDDSREAKEAKKRKAKTNHEPVIYTREQKACVPQAFANFYGHNQENIRGKGITGEDKHMIPAVKKDTNGLSYNVLNWVYDLNTRKAIEGIAVVPIDFNDNGKLDENETIYENLDELISKIETGKVPEIPVEYVNIQYPAQFNDKTENLKLFVQYILNEGQKLNHQYGFLDFEPENLAKQKEVAEASFQTRSKN